MALMHAIDAAIDASLTTTDRPEPGLAHDAPRLAQDAAHAAGREPADGIAQPGESAIALDPAARTALRSTIVKQLEHRERLLIVLWYAERLSPEEIGLVLGEPAETIRAEHERLLGSLRDVALQAAA
jgi:DNA-directed RNA polymerase specialized sigma24 family protein